MSHDIDINAPVIIVRPLMPFDGATGIVTKHVWREGHAAYVVLLNIPAGIAGDVTSVVILARHIEALRRPDGSQDAEDQRGPE